jgi:hypothetical protein
MRCREGIRSPVMYRRLYTLDGKGADEQRADEEGLRGDAQWREWRSRGDGRHREQGGVTGWARQERGTPSRATAREG